MNLSESAITPRRAALAAQLISWARDYLSAPYPGPGFARTGAICPYTRTMVDDGKLRVLLAENLDGSDLEPLVVAALQMSTYSLSTMSADMMDTAVVLGFPDLPDAAAMKLLDEVVEHLTNTMLSLGMNLAAVAQLPGSKPDDPWPLGAQCPMPALVMRRMGPWDAALARSLRYARAHHRLFRDYYEQGRMTRHDGRTFERMCARYNLPLTRPTAAAGPGPGGG